jgi:hypothetical protein
MQISTVPDLTLFGLDPEPRTGFDQRSNNFRLFKKGNVIYVNNKTKIYHIFI